MTRNQLVIVGVAVLAVVLAAVGYFVFFPNSSDAVPANSGGPGYTVAGDDHTMGSPKAPVVIIEYAAPTCPHCAHFDEDVFPQIKQNYIDTGKVFYVFRVFPLHPSDGAAEAMARCLPKDNYFEFIDLLFRNQREWDWEYQVGDIHGGLVKMGRIAGMSADQVDKCIADKAVAEHINKVAQDGQARYNITGTPTFVINGAVHSSIDVGTWEDMRAVVEPLLAKK